jgi:hypothetical protein
MLVKPINAFSGFASSERIKTKTRLHFYVKEVRYCLTIHDDVHKVYSKAPLERLGKSLGGRQPNQKR